ncbi:uncharacterized protein BDR25DRAFT_260993 [Lindgomyces ingoldianus]|uniref:Uncharacterized protein n=1 Tax=Lindgomyces ingoldianus TaxID=673940 RepID=A0ACB6QZE6_9PLEO|nr:uncharacterized protein BDR25DRAFT_260993 [Lindgomyces ingoldianus]KAF2471440.1 hypothetical protein BDR25DRAFT_260993 [Lindgomyces ingoldianus]
MPSLFLKVSLVLVVSLALTIQITPDARENILPTPNVSTKEAVGTAGAKIKLHATSEQVWRDLIDFGKYGEWSKRVPSVDFGEDKGKLKEGMVGVMTVVPPNASPNTFPVEIISISQSTHTLVWKSLTGLPDWVILSERVQEVVDLPGQPGWSQYRTWDTWKGPFAYVMQWVFKKGIEENLEG